MKTVTLTALVYLRKHEWTTGNGQCEECAGCAPRKGWWTETVGHKKNCQLGKAIESLGGKVEWERPNHSKAHREFVKLTKRMAERVFTKPFPPNMGDLK